MRDDWNTLEQLFKEGDAQNKGDRVLPGDQIAAEESNVCIIIVTLSSTDAHNAVIDIRMTMQRRWGHSRDLPSL